MKSKLIILAFPALLAISVKAQVFSDQLMFLQSQTQFMTFQNQIYSNMNKENLERDERNRKANHGKKSKSSKKSSSSSSNCNENNFSFTPSNNIIQEVEKKIVNNLKQRNPAAGKNLETALAKDKPYPKYIALLNKLGLNTENNYADVFTAYMLGMWRIANQLNSNPTEVEIQAVRRQVVSNVDVSGFDNREKQEKAAYLIYDLIFANEPYEASRKSNNQKQLQSDSDEVNNRFIRQARLYFRNMKISENGFVKRSDTIKTNG